MLIAGLVLRLLGANDVSNWLLCIGTLLGTLPVAVGMVREIMSGKIGVDIIAITAILSALALQEYWAAAVVLFMLTSGEALEAYAQERARTELTALLKRSPKLAHRKRGRELEEITVAQIRVHDTLIIKPGETIPADGTVHRGTSNLDESALTGESMPVSVKPGSEVLSGAINEDELLEITVARSAKDSQYEQIVELVRQAASNRSPLVRLADRFSIPFTLITFTIAGLAWYCTGLPVRALEVLVVATPCPLLIATPVAIVAGMSRSARHGIIVKDGGALEILSRVHTMAFDKTGTLTRGEPSIEKIETISISQAEALRLAASVELGSTHIFAEVITKAAKARRLKPYAVSHLEEIPGRGVMARVQGTTIMVGNYAWLKSQKVRNLQRLGHGSSTDVFIARTGRLVGRISFRDSLRPETRSTLDKLAQLGIRQRLMLTGDTDKVAQHIATEAGISKVYSQLLPQDKLSTLQKLPKSLRPVAMVGDGINDAPTLAAADVGIALGARGSTAASESAGIVIMRDDLTRVPLAVEISQRTVSIALGSIYFGIGVSTVLMLIAAIGGIRPVVGAILQEGLDVIVILNALRARHGKR